MSNLVQQRRGRGGPTFRSPRHGSHALFKMYLDINQADYPLTVTDIQHEPGRTTSVLTLKTQSGKLLKSIAVSGNYVGQIIAKNDKTPGAMLKLKEVPYGEPICCIQNKVNGKPVFARASGVFATLLKVDQNYAVIKLNKTFIKLNPNCMAIYGIPAGAGKYLKPILKAGTKCKMLKSKAKRPYSVSAKHKNNCDHPFGGSKSKYLGRKKCSSRNAPPGAKVGNIAPKRTGKK